MIFMVVILACVVIYFGWICLVLKEARDDYREMVIRRDQWLEEERVENARVTFYLHQKGLITDYHTFDSLRRQAQQQRALAVYAGDKDQA